MTVTEANYPIVNSSSFQNPTQKHPHGLWTLVKAGTSVGHSVGAIAGAIIAFLVIIWMYSQIQEASAFFGGSSFFDLFKALFLLQFFLYTSVFAILGAMAGFLNGVIVNAIGNKLNLAPAIGFCTAIASLLIFIFFLSSTFGSLGSSSTFATTSENSDLTSSITLLLILFIPLGILGAISGWMLKRRLEECQPSQNALFGDTGNLSAGTPQQVNDISWVQAQPTNQQQFQAPNSQQPFVAPPNNQF